MIEEVTVIRVKKKLLLSIVRVNAFFLLIKVQSDCLELFLFWPKK